MITPSNRDIQRMQRELAPATFKRGVLTAINFSAWTADAYVIGNQQSVIRGIPMSSAISPSTAIGSRCRIDMFDPTTPTDMVVAYTYGTKPTPTFSVTSGTATFASAGSTTITHGLKFNGIAVTPTFATLSPANAIVVPSGGGTFDLGAYVVSWDSTYIHIYVESSQSTTVSWVAFYISL